MRPILCIAAICTSRLLVCAQEPTSEMLDSLRRETRDSLLVSTTIPTELNMVLHDDPRDGATPARLSWSVTNESGTATVESWKVLSNAPTVLSCSARLEPAEAKEIVTIATSLMATVRSDNYFAWTGPRCGLDISLDSAMQWKRDEWKKWSHYTNVLFRADLAGHIARLRSITSNAMQRAASQGAETNRK